MKISFSACLLISFFSVAWSQDYNFENDWQNIGPTTMPEARSLSEGGIGPVEFIRISDKDPNLMLAGSLNGGLFFSQNGGDLWETAGSDVWNYSNCAWAEIYPSDNNMWFAVSMRDGFGAEPGNIGKNGGVLRTRNRGATWESVANYSVFENNQGIIIFGLRFSSNDPKKMYVLTSKGLYFTEDCTADFLKWNKVSYVNGVIYDLEVESNYLCFSIESKKKWNIMISDNQKLVPIPELEKESRAINKVTIESQGGFFYFLIDFKNSKDEVWRYDPQSKKIEMIFNKGRISFGGGYAFAINPHNNNEFMIGNGVRVAQWLIKEQTFSKIGSDYHVDIECIAYHPVFKDIMYIGSHGGVFKSIDNGMTWEFKSNGIGNAEVLGLSVSTINPKAVAVGLFHNGSLVHADWNSDGHYFWKQVNGGDALIPTINPFHDSIVYTSNQYISGGLYFSSDTAKHNRRLHSRNTYATPGWSMAVQLHPLADSVLYFNFKEPTLNNKGNIDIVRSLRPHDSEKFQRISNFKESHGLLKYKVYNLYTSKFHPNLLFAYVLSTEKIKGKDKKVHRLFMLRNALGDSEVIINQWEELELPRNTWVADVVVHPKKANKVYISYANGMRVNQAKPDDKGMIYYIKYNKSDLSIKRNWDISANIPSAKSGSRNMVVTKNKDLFIGTSTGVYFGNKSTLRGGKSWQLIGRGELPNCKVSGLDYNINNQILTISYGGRGVWQIDLTSN